MGSGGLRHGPNKRATGAPAAATLGHPEGLQLRLLAPGHQTGEAHHPLVALGHPPVLRSHGTEVVIEAATRVGASKVRIIVQFPVLLGQFHSKGAASPEVPWRIGTDDGGGLRLLGLPHATLGRSLRQISLLSSLRGPLGGWRKLQGEGYVLSL